MPPSTPVSDRIKLIAPAKVNLFLHVLGKNENNYHNLQSLITFTDFGDEIIISPADEFKFLFDSTADNLPHDENNLVICAAKALAGALNKPLNCHIHLTKNIPIGAGLGGGSSDAAATVKGLLKFWNTQIDDKTLAPLLLNLGADVPCCYYNAPCYIEKTGEDITPIMNLPTLYGVLIYPNAHCSTQDIFEQYDSNYSSEITLPTSFENEDDLLTFLLSQKNDLTPAAIKNIPDIKDIITAIESQNGHLLSRMSGSGSACFGVFKTKEQSLQAVQNILSENKNWWGQAVTIS